MSRSLASFKNPKAREAAIARRIKEGERDFAGQRMIIGGLGYWAARDARANYGVIGGPAKPHAIG